MANTEAPVRVHIHWLMKVIFALGAVISAWDLGGNWQQGHLLETAASAMVTLTITLGFFLAGTVIDADQQGIRVAAPYGVYELQWTEMRTANIKGNAARFYGDGKALRLYLLLAGKGKREFLEYVARSIRERNIPAERPPAT
jgi:hypothetical protein